MRSFRGCGFIFLVLALLITAGVLEAETTLDFEARVAAQAAIERVYHSHRIGAPASFEEAVPRVFQVFGTLLVFPGPSRGVLL